MIIEGGKNSKIISKQFWTIPVIVVAVIGVMPVNWQEKVRASTQEKAQLLTDE